MNKKINMVAFQLILSATFIFPKIEASLKDTNSQQLNSAKLPFIIIDASDIKPAINPAWQKIDKHITKKYASYGTDAIGKIAFQTMLGLAITKLSSVVHELGHATAFKLLLGLSTSLYIPLTLKPALHGCIVFDQCPKEGINMALMYAAGPLFGIVTGFAALKINSIIHELITNTKLPIKERLLVGFKKPFFHEKQQPGITISALYIFFNQITQFIPQKAVLPQILSTDNNNGITFSDGYGFLQALGFNNIPTF